MVSHSSTKKISLKIPLINSEYYPIHIPLIFSTQLIPFAHPRLFAWCLAWLAWMIPWMIRASHWLGVTWHKGTAAPRVSHNLIGQDDSDVELFAHLPWVAYSEDLNG
jgi:hypothetical protein